MKTLNFNEVFVDFTVRSMLNPHNKDFYLDKLSIAQVEDLLTGADDGLVDCFWQAFSRAYGYTFHDYELAVYQDYHFQDKSCPECACRDYIVGVACPNCEYVEC